MNNIYNDDSFKKMLANLCVINAYNPSVINISKIENVAIKPTENSDWIKLIDQSQYNQHKNNHENIAMKMEYIDKHGKMQTLNILDLKDLAFDIKDNTFIALSKYDNNNRLYASTNFMELYYEELRKHHPEIDTHLHAIHHICEEVGKTLVFVPGDLLVLDKQLPLDRAQLDFEEIEEGMRVRLIGDMYSPDTKEVPEKIDTKVLATAHEEFDSFEVTIVEGEGMIFVSFDMYPDLYMERDHDPEKDFKAMVPLENRLLEEYWIRKLNGVEPEKEIGEEGESYPSPLPKFPDKEIDPYPDLKPEIDYFPHKPATHVGDLSYDSLEIKAKGQDIEGGVYLDR